MTKFIKTNLTWLGFIVIVIIIVVLLVFRGERNFEQTEDVLLSPSPSFSVSPVIRPISTRAAIPKPGLDIKVYNDLLVEYDGRYIALASDCRSSDPSNVDYKNGTQIMLDNIASAEARVIKIGDKSYSVTAQGWTFITLTSPTLPVNLSMFCGTMELGQIGIVN